MLFAMVICVVHATTLHMYSHTDIHTSVFQELEVWQLPETPGHEWFSELINSVVQVHERAVPSQGVLTTTHCVYVCVFWFYQKMMIGPELSEREAAARMSRTMEAMYYWRRAPFLIGDIVDLLCELLLVHSVHPVYVADCLSLSLSLSPYDCPS